MVLLSWQAESRGYRHSLAVGAKNYSLCLVGWVRLSQNTRELLAKGLALGGDINLEEGLYSSSLL